MTRRQLAWVMGALCLAVTLGVVVARQYYVLVSGTRSSDPDFVVYRLDEPRRLLLGKDIVLLINTKEHVVVSLPPSFGWRIGPVALWPRDSLRGIVLGDAIKGNERDSYCFADDGLDIHYSDATGNHDLHMTL